MIQWETIMKVLFINPRFQRHADDNPELHDVVPMSKYLGSPSLGIASLAALTPPDWQIEYRDDRLAPADGPTDADLVAFSVFTPAAMRAFELSRVFHAMGKRTVAGGIFPTMMPEAASLHFDAIVQGEGEGSWLRVLADAQAGTLKPRYRCDDPVDPAKLPPPRLSLYLDAETDDFCPVDYPVQISRGCPLNCQACVLPISMTRKMRDFPLDSVIDRLEFLGRAGKLACLTEDTSWFAGHGRNRLSALFDAMAARPEVAGISYIGISMPMILRTPEALLYKARAAGVKRVYVVCGFDPITMRAFTGKDERALDYAYTAIAKCHAADIEPYTSFLLGNDDDDPGAVDRMLAFAAKAGIRKAEFAIFTPYPGTPSWHRLLAEDRILQRDWSKYNDANVVFRPARMTPEELHVGYLRLWRDFYSDRREEFADMPVAERTIQF
jgi:radical SAM superfamily enzyme YgiQ (UPF0313 family)